MDNVDFRFIVGTSDVALRIFFVGNIGSEIMVKTCYDHIGRVVSTDIAHGIGHGWK